MSFDSIGTTRQVQSNLVAEAKTTDESTDETETLDIVGYTKNDLRALVAALDDADEPPTTRVLMPNEVLSDTFDLFSVGTAAADLIKEDVLALRNHNDVTKSVGSDPVASVFDDAGYDSPTEVASDAALSDTLTAEASASASEKFVSVPAAAIGDTTHIVGQAANRSFVVPVEIDRFGEAVRDGFQVAWENAEPYEVRTVSWSSFLSVLDDACKPETRESVEAAVIELGRVAPTFTTKDVVNVSILAAAHSEELLYDIGWWAESAGLASKATMSRSKTALEQAGYITTSDVPIDVGRPRLRLELPPEYADATPEDLIEIYQSWVGSGAPQAPPAIGVA